MIKITVGYDSEKTIRVIIESVLKQEQNNVKYITIDGVQKDKATNIIFEYSEISQSLFLKKMMNFMIIKLLAK